MDEITRTENYRLYWYDDRHSVLVLEITDHWTWTDARYAVDRVNQAIFSAPDKVYSIYHFAAPQAGVIPTGDILGNFKQMMEAEAYEEELVIFVGKDFLRPIRRFITIIVDTFSVSQASKFHFVDTFEQALELVQQTRSTPAD
ncbi:MAG: hypothetical protein AAFV33_15345 [Chloroflexota bacterium]